MNVEKYCVDAFTVYSLFVIPGALLFFSGPTPGVLLESGVLPESGALNFFSGNFKVDS